MQCKEVEEERKARHEENNKSQGTGEVQRGGKRGRSEADRSKGGRGRGTTQVREEEEEEEERNDRAEEHSDRAEERLRLEWKEEEIHQIKEKDRRTDEESRGRESKVDHCGAGEGVRRRGTEVCQGLRWEEMETRHRAVREKEANRSSQRRVERKEEDG